MTSMKLIFTVATLNLCLITLNTTQAEETAPSVAPSDTASTPSLADYTFISPADNDPKLEEFACGIRFGFRQVISNVEGGSLAELKRIGPKTAELTTMVGSQDFQVGKGNLSDIAVTTVRDEKQCALTLGIFSAKPFKRGNFINLWKPPTFTAADILVQTHKFLYRPSFISPYPAASIMANFDRLAVKGCDNVGYGANSEIPRDLRGSYETVYCLKVDGKNVPALPECHPYRDGSKCTVLAVIPGDRIGNTFDARPSAEKLRKAVEVIIGD